MTSQQNVSSVTALVDMAMKRGRARDLYFVDGKFEIKKDGAVVFTFSSKEEVINHIMTHNDLFPASEESAKAVSAIVSKFRDKSHDLSVLGESSTESSMSESQTDDSDDDEEDDLTEDGEEDSSSDTASFEASKKEKTPMTTNLSFDFDSTPKPDSSSKKNHKGKSAQEIANEAIGVTVDTKGTKPITLSKKDKKKAEKAAKAAKNKEKAASAAVKGKGTKSEKKATEATPETASTVDAPKKKAGRPPKKAEMLGKMDKADEITQVIEESGDDVAPTKKGKKGKDVFEPETVLDLTTNLGYSPKDIRQEKKPITVQLLVDRIKNNEIDFDTFFQRSPDLWSNVMKSRLIESIFMYIHINPLVFDGSNANKWDVVDGLQRLSAIRHFIVGMRKMTKSGPVKSMLKLSGLRALPDLNGKTYATLPRDLQRQLNEFAFDITVLLEGTPDEVKFEIFERTNTGGLKLSEQEIRNALFRGPMLSMIQDVIDDGMFNLSTHELIPTKRSTDQELILRHFAIRVFNKEYTGDNKTFFNKSLKELNKFNVDKLEELKNDFIDALTVAYKIWDKFTFRKVMTSENISKTYQVSRTLYESVSVALAELSREDRTKLVAMKDDVRAAFDYMFKDEPEFVSALTTRTNEPKTMHKRLQYVREAFADLLNGTFFSEETPTEEPVVASSEEATEVKADEVDQSVESTVDSVEDADVDEVDEESDEKTDSDKSAE